ncbi:hypothetical protein FDI40_gp655 [Agrobacterium phage Atu_ph07]|uniref:Uncharacterized protein n=1 Tax=Agrobacterium phage Atu_ph07 TaxID=2024264 RepID=A0A2L0V0U0_9CAUD|nr:hypothetical protein FDI40_gp655 [Agrobacterium phage Atu_ph07]AUZ95414.1 hypothetical protein [Agrobacterium phage Atu_ph07]
MTFLHMHHVMANDAIMKEQIESDDFFNVNKERLREIVLSGEVDYKPTSFDDKHLVVTDEDRQIVMDYLGC